MPFEYRRSITDRTPPEVQAAIKRFRSLPLRERVKRPLLYWLLGDGTPPFKLTKPEAAYLRVSPFAHLGHICGTCLHAYTHTTTGTMICDQMRGVIHNEAWCRLWRPPIPKKRYEAYQNR
tara:strand:- start:661 stop:1020 length:360 start_codon:yes stop_codon:yes gene_type:complete